MKRDHSRLFIAAVLIVVGGLWTLKELGINVQMEQIFAPVSWIFSRLGRIIFSWPMVLLVIGLILVSGSHRGGWILVALGGFFLLPKIFLWQPFPFGLVFPLAVLSIGVFMVTRK